MVRSSQSPRSFRSPVARAIFDAVAQGEEDIFPDPMSETTRRLPASICAHRDQALAAHSDVGERAARAGRLPLERADRDVHALLPLRPRPAESADRGDHRVRQPGDFRTLRLARISRLIAPTQSSFRLRGTESDCSRVCNRQGSRPHATRSSHAPAPRSRRQMARSARLKGRPQAKPGAGTLAERRRRDSEVPELTGFVRVW
jgi:hypothetical protein